MGNCCSGAEEKHVKMCDINKNDGTTDRKKKRKGKKGTSLPNGKPTFEAANGVFADFEERFKNNNEDLFTDPGELGSDNGEDDEEMDEDEITLEKEGNTKELFKKSFMDKIVKYCPEAIQETYKDLGPFKYR